MVKHHSVGYRFQIHMGQHFSELQMNPGRKLGFEVSSFSYRYLISNNPHWGLQYRVCMKFSQNSLSLLRDGVHNNS